MDRRRRYEDDSSDDSDGANPAKRFHANGVPPNSPASPTPSETEEEGGVVECVNIPLTRTHSPETSGVGESEAVGTGTENANGRENAEDVPHTTATVVEQPFVDTKRDDSEQVASVHDLGKEVGEQEKDDDTR